MIKIDAKLVYAYAEKSGALYIDDKIASQFFTQDQANVLKLLGLDYEIRQLDITWFRNIKKFPEDLQQCVFDKD